MPHSHSAMYLSLVVTGIKAERLSGKAPTTHVLRLISRLSRSMALFVRILVVCSQIIVDTFGEGFSTL